MTINAVRVDSTPRRNRYQVANGILWATRGERSPRSSAITPKPPAWIIQSAACNALSVGVSLGCGAAHFTQSNRLRSTPVDVADRGFSELFASMTAANSPLSVNCFSKEISNVVRPEESGPQISVRAPRGMPSQTASRAGIPISTVSG